MCRLTGWFAKLAGTMKWSRKFGQRAKMMGWVPSCRHRNVPQCLVESHKKEPEMPPNTRKACQSVSYSISCVCLAVLRSLRDVRCFVSSQPHNSVRGKVAHESVLSDTQHSGTQRLIRKTLSPSNGRGPERELAAARKRDRSIPVTGDPSSQTSSRKILRSAWSGALARSLPCRTSDAIHVRGVGYPNLALPRARHRRHLAQAAL